MMAYAMEENQIHIATMVKAGRLAKGYTQLELAQLCKIGLRSVQRVESGKAAARSYTLKSLAEVLELEFPEVALVAEPNRLNLHHIKVRHHSLGRVLMAIVIGLIMMLFAFAFIFQSPSFPETTFELFIYWALVCCLYLLILVRFLR
jgi:transcriptional regulator with XRE-family HTH domain